MPSSSAPSDVEVAVDGRLSRWQSHNADRQARILEAAVELIETSAPGAEIPIHRIADRAGLATSVIYRQFSGRDDLDKRVRSFVHDQFSDALEVALSIQSSSGAEIIRRTIRAVVDWESDHPRLYEFLGTGPTSEETGEIDAVGSLKSRIAAKATETIVALAEVIGIDDSKFESMAFAVVTMVEGAVSHWVRDPALTANRDAIVDELATYAWYVLDGVLKEKGLTIDPMVEIATVVNQLIAERSSNSAERSGSLRYLEDFPSM